MNITICFLSEMAPLRTAALALCIFALCTAHSLPAQNEEEEFLKTAETVNVGYAAPNSLAHSQNQNSNTNSNNFVNANGPYWWMSMGENSPFRRASAIKSDVIAPSFVVKPKPQTLDFSNNPFLNGESKTHGFKAPGVVNKPNVVPNPPFSAPSLSAPSPKCDVCVSKQLCQNGYVRANVQGLTQPRDQVRNIL